MLVRHGEVLSDAGHNDAAAGGKRSVGQLNGLVESVAYGVARGRERLAFNGNHLPGPFSPG